MPEENRIVSASLRPGVYRMPDGRNRPAPEGWALLPPGDATLTRRVKQGGPTWTIQEKKGRRTFSRGVLADAARIADEREKLEAERATPAYAKKLAAGRARSAKKQVAYVEDFGAAVRAYLAFDPVYAGLEKALAQAVTAHATPVGSGTVARTQRIPVAQRAEAAVIAWLRHQTTAYDHMAIARVKGRRREVRRELAAASKQLLERYRRGEAVAVGCPLAEALGYHPSAARSRESG